MILILGDGGIANNNGSRYRYEKRMSYHIICTTTKIIIIEED